MRHVISVIVENEFGVLSRVAGLFSGRGYNIESLCVAETEEPEMSRMTIVTSGDDRVIEQILKQLNKLINVYKVFDLTHVPAIHRVLMLLKININAKTRSDILKAVELFEGRMVDVDQKACIAEFAADAEKTQSIIQFFRPFGIIELARTGDIAMRRGKAGVEEQ